MSEDRTSEFFAIANSLSPSSTITGSSGSFHQNNTRFNSSTSTNPPPPPPADEAMSSLRNFHNQASSISIDIASTSSMLSELTHLVRRQRGLFVDDTERLNTLVLNIKSKIENLNVRLEEAQGVIDQHKRMYGRGRSGGKGGAGSGQASQEASNLVGQLKEEFVRATGRFKVVLQQRSDGLKDASENRRGLLFGSDGDGGNNGRDEKEDLLRLGNKPPVYEDSDFSGSNSFLNDGARGPSLGGGAAMNVPKLDLTNAVLMSQRQKGKESSMLPPAGESSSSGSQLPRPYGASGDMYTSSSGVRQRHSSSEQIPTYSGSVSSHTTTNSSLPSQPLTPLDIQRMESESGQQQMMQLIPDQDYLRERADAMDQVESNIVELGTIFNKLAVMVSENREMVQRVEDNVDDANDNINMSMATLVDTFENLKTNRALFMKIFGIIVVFIVLFILFFA